MTGAEWFNTLSLLLGLVAWLLPIAGIAQKRIAGRDNPALPAVSMACCSLSLCMQILFNNSKVGQNDWAGLSDSAATVAGLSMLLLVVTIMLNAILLLMMRKPSLKRVK